MSRTTTYKTSAAMRLIRQMPEMVCHISTFEDAGISRGIIWHLTRNLGRLENPSRGLFALPGAPREAIQERLAVDDQAKARRIIERVYQNTPLRLSMLRSLGVSKALFQAMVRDANLQATDAGWVLPAVFTQPAKGRQTLKRPA